LRYTAVLKHSLRFFALNKAQKIFKGEQGLYNSLEIKEILKKNALTVSKAMGQNFLIDKEKRAHIIKLCSIGNDETILEVGPGLGALTECIQPLCRNLIAVEKDRGLSAVLSGLFKDKQNTKIVNSDILKYNVPYFKNKIKVIGNLPYYITSPIIFHFIALRGVISSIFATVQKEVACRITAKPGGRDYGILTLGVGYYCHAEVLCKIGRKSFFPQPAVDSSFIKMSIREKPQVVVKNEKHLFDIIKAGFNQRRKTLFNALSNSKELSLKKSVIAEALGFLNLDMNIRAEELGIEEWALLSDLL